METSDQYKAETTRVAYHGTPVEQLRAALGAAEELEAMGVSWAEAAETERGHALLWRVSLCASAVASVATHQKNSAPIDPEALHKRRMRRVITLVKE